MIIIITGATHTGKTALAQKLLEKLRISCLSQDHLKMGLIRSGLLRESADSPDDVLTEKVWPVTREIIKTAIENKQSLIVEGCYVPFSWKSDLDEKYLAEIRFLCLCFSERYIKTHFSDILEYGNCIEERLDDGYCTTELLTRENERFRVGCSEHGLPCLLIDDDYENTIGKVISSAAICPAWKQEDK